MTPLERFDQWRKDNPEKMRQISEKARIVLGLDAGAFEARIKGMRWWLASEKGQKKAAKYHKWELFIQRNLPERNYAPRRIRPSRVSGSTGEVRFS